MSGMVALATPDRRLRRNVIFKMNKSIRLSKPIKNILISIKNRIIDNRCPVINSFVIQIIGIYNIIMIQKLFYNMPAYVACCSRY